MSTPDRHEMRVGFVAGDSSDTKQLKVRLPEGDLKPWDLDTKHTHVGSDFSRIDGLEKVTGAAEYTFDINLPGMLHGAILRSRIPAGRVVNVDVSAAERMPGVKAVVEMKGPNSRRKRVLFVGDVIAAVAAETRDQALDALEKIEVEYERAAHTTDFLDAADAPKLENGEIVSAWPEHGDDRIADALGDCSKTATGTWRCDVQTHAALETHGHVCRFGDDGSVDIWASTQATVITKLMFASQLGVSMDKVRVHSEFVGGGFGAKFNPGAEGVACAMLARETKAPVKLMLDRYEEHTCTGNRPSALMQIRAGIDDDAKITAFDYRAFGGPGFRDGPGTTKIPKHYLEDAAVRENHTELVTDTDMGRAMRAPGHPQGYFAAEGMLDELARLAGLDPLAFRLKNDYDAVRIYQWNAGAKEFDWQNRWRAYDADRSGRFLRGAGLSSAFWGQLGGNNRRLPPNKVMCRIHKDGTVESRNAAQDIGTGMKTVLALLTAEELQLDPAEVHVRMGHTDDPVGPGSGGSTTTPTLAPAARLAAGMARQRLEALVASHLDVDASAVRVENGRWGVPGGKTLSFRDACKLIELQPIECIGERFDNYRPYKNSVSGCQFAEVEVDTETGFVRVTELLALQDCGLVIAKKLAESQVLGAMIGGLSYALHERRIMDKARGRMLNGDLMMYKVAGTADMPKLTARMLSVANGANNVGAAGLGEPPSVATPAAIANAVGNAIGVPVRSIPITPDVVLAALETRQGGKR